MIMKSLIYTTCLLSLCLASVSMYANEENNPHEALNTLDTRTPLPLLPRMALHQKHNMQQHLITVQNIVLAIASNDFDAVIEHSKDIATSKQTQKMCSMMGSSSPAFVAMGNAFHESADTIIAAAGERDAQKTLDALGKTIQHCTSCHSQFRQDIVSTLQ